MPVRAERGRIVLVVDDDPATLRFLQHALEHAGCTVLVATSGDAAIMLLAWTVPDLILMDAVMPGRSGFETTSLIKADAALAQIPIIFTTGLEASEHAVRAFDVGGTDYLRKPIDLDELLARVRTHLSTSQALRASMAGIESTGRMMMAIDRGGRFLWGTPAAERLIAEVQPGWKSEVPLTGQIAAAIRRLLEMSDPQRASVRLPPPHAVELALVTEYGSNELLVRLSKANPEAEAGQLQAQLRLTGREAEVLLWVSYGKPNRVIADILGISLRTVHKHLERIFDKLGIETRSAAAAIAVRLIGQ